MGAQTHAIDVGRFRSQAPGAGATPDVPGPPDADAARDGGPWRGLDEARWIEQLLRGAPPPRESAAPIAGPLAHG